MNTGWIKLHRKLLENIIFTSEKGLKVWIWVLLRANHAPEDVFMGRDKIHLNPGQFVTGRNVASEQLHMAVGTIWYWLEMLTGENLIERKATNKYSVITVKNWVDYQESRTQIEQQIDEQIEPNKNDKNDKNYNNADKPEDGSELEKELELKKQGIQNEWQYFGIEMWKQLNAPVEKKGECIRIAKVYPRSQVTMALGFAIDYPTKSLMWKMFIWKLNKIRKEANEKPATSS